MKNIISNSNNNVSDDNIEKDFNDAQESELFKEDNTAAQETLLAGLSCENETSGGILVTNCSRPRTRSA